MAVASGSVKPNGGQKMDFGLNGGAATCQIEEVGVLVEFVEYHASSIFDCCGGKYGN